MGILVNRDTTVLVQGITGAYARIQVRLAKAYGTRIVAGVTPGKEGQTVCGVPVYDTVSRALQHHAVDAALIYVSPRTAREAAVEALDNRIGLIVIGTEGIPLHDTVYLRARAEREKAWIVGPNGIGLFTAGKTCLGSVVPSLKAGRLGVVSRSGSLGSFVLQLLKSEDIGVSTFVSTGGDSVLGRNPSDYLKLFDTDQQTEAMLFVGEIGGLKEYDVARTLPDLSKPVIAYIVGKTAVPGKRMGHIGAIVSHHSDGAQAKIDALRDAGALVADTPWHVVELYRGLK